MNLNHIIIGNNCDQTKINKDACANCTISIKKKHPKKHGENCLEIKYNGQAYSWTDPNYQKSFFRKGENVDKIFKLGSHLKSLSECPKR